MNQFVIDSTDIWQICFKFCKDPSTFNKVMNSDHISLLILILFSSLSVQLQYSNHRLHHYHLYRLKLFSHNNKLTDFRRDAESLFFCWTPTPRFKNLGLPIPTPTLALQTWSASVSSRQGSAVSNRMLHSNISSYRSPVVPFCQPPSTHCAMSLSHQVRPSGVLCRWFDGLSGTHCLITSGTQRSALTVSSHASRHACFSCFHCIRHAAH